MRAEIDLAYAAWLAAKAKIAALETRENEDDVLERAGDKLTAAEHRLSFTSATKVGQIATKLEVLETMISDCEYVGYPADHRHMLMLASIKADLRQLSDRA